MPKSRYTRDINSRSVSAHNRVIRVRNSESEPAWGTIGIARCYIPFLKLWWATVDCSSAYSVNRYATYGMIHANIRCLNAESIF